MCVLAFPSLVLEIAFCTFPSFTYNQRTKKEAKIYYWIKLFQA